MTVISLGTSSVGASVPGAAVAVSAGVSGVTGALPDLETRIAAMASFSATPITFSEQIEIAEAIIASINTAIGAGVIPPDNAVQVAIVSAQLAVLQAQLIVIEAQLALLVDLQAPLLVGGIGAWAYDGDAANFGAEVGPVIAGALSGHINAVIMATGSPTAWAALGEIVKVTP